MGEKNWDSQFWIGEKKKERKAILFEQLCTDLPHSLKALLQKITSDTEHWKIEISCQKKVSASAVI